MSRDRRTWAAFLLAAAVTLAGLCHALADAGSYHATRGAATYITCQEDEPCWQCERMGNQRCAP